MCCHGRHKMNRSVCTARLQSRFKLHPLVISIRSGLYSAAVFPYCLLFGVVFFEKQKEGKLKKFNLVFALLALPVLFLACGSGEAPANDATEEVEDVTVEATIVNGLEDYEIAEIWIDPSDGSWSENLITENLLPGEEFTVTLDEPGSYDLWVTDEDGDTYTKYNIEIDESDYEWEVVLEDGDWNVPETTVTITNGLGDWTIYFAYCDYSSSDSWSEDRLGSEVLEPGESISFTVDANDNYDFKCIDEDDDEYFMWDVWVGEDGFEWNVQLSDMDTSVEEPQEGDVPITIHNGLGDWTIWYVYGDPSDGPQGEDRLGTELIEPGEEFTFYVPAGSTYDLRVEDEDSDTYTLRGIEIAEDGYYWEVELSDMD